MANDFSGVAFFGYQGTVARFPVKLPQGVLPPINRPQPSVVPVTINWNLYWQLAFNVPNVGVEINLQAASVQAVVLDRIASVKIDNTGCSNSVYVRFPDTGDVINCPPNCSVTFPCLTGNIQAEIIALGLTPGFITRTRVFFYNVDLTPAVDYEVSQAVSLYKASPSITRGNTILNTNFGTPALGDQLSTAALSMSIPGSVARLWGTPYATGFIYVNNIEAYVFNVTAGGQFGISVESTGAAGQLFDISGISQSSEYKNVLDMSGMNIKLDATQTWQIHNENTLVNGSFKLYSCFTKSEV